MAKIIIPFLREKAGRWYWQPSAALAKAGWKAMKLGADAEIAQKAAKARNAEVDEWKLSGQKPATVKRFSKARTMSALIRKYEEEQLVKHKPNTQKVYRSALRAIETWSGDFPIASITRARVKVLKTSLMKPAKGSDTPRHHRAHGVLRVLRTLMEFAVNEDLIAVNPAVNFDLETPPPRQEIGSDEVLEYILAAADKSDTPSIGLAIRLGYEIGQREEDILRLGKTHWKEIKGLPRELFDSLTAGSNDPRVMGFKLKQFKTNNWVGIPVVGDLRSQIELAIADNAKLDPAPATIVIDDSTKRPWAIRQFQRKFAEIRADAATKARKEGNEQLAVDIERFQYRDLRRTCVVHLGELGLEDQLIAAITGHKLETVKKILEVYMPRTTKMAARAVVARLEDRRAREEQPNEEKEQQA